MNAFAAVTEIETAVIRKLRWRILPFLMLLYFVSFLNRVNVGFAALTMNRDLGISDTFYGFAAGVFAFARASAWAALEAASISAFTFSRAFFI